MVLQEVSDALRTAARLEDVVARWGGDEFVVVAALDERRALALAQRLLETIRNRPSSSPASRARISASIGVAVRTAPIDEQEWLRRADEAMYTAKRQAGIPLWWGSRALLLEDALSGVGESLTTLWADVAVLFRGRRLLYGLGPSGARLDPPDRGTRRCPRSALRDVPGLRLRPHRALDARRKRLDAP